MLDEIEVRKRLAKKMKRFNIFTSTVDTSLITSTVITGVVSITAFGYSKKNTMQLNCLPPRKLETISDIVSQAIHGGDISFMEFHKVFQEVEKYCKLKTDIINQAITKVRQFTKNSKKNYLRRVEKKQMPSSV